MHVDVDNDRANSRKGGSNYGITARFLEIVAKFGLFDGRFFEAFVLDTASSATVDEGPLGVPCVAVELERLVVRLLSFLGKTRRCGEDDEQYGYGDDREDAIHCFVR